MKKNTLLKFVDGLENVVAALGTNRDKKSYTNYVLSNMATQMQMDSIYASSWLARKIVHEPVNDMFTKGWQLKFDEREFDPKIFNKWKTTSILCEALKWSRLYGGCAVIIGVKGLDLDQPLPEVIRPRSLSYFKVVDRYHLSGTGDIEMDIESPNFNLPKFYIHSTSPQQIHHSRVVRFDGRSLPHDLWVLNDRWGESEIAVVNEAITNYDTSTSLVLSMMFEATVDVITSPNLGEVLASENGESLVTKRFQTAMLMKSVNRTLILDKDELYEKKSNNFTNLADIVDCFKQCVSGASGIPQARLFGDTPGGLNATGKGEMENYYDMISRMQTEVTEQMKTILNLQLQNLGIMDDYEIIFNPLFQVSAQDLAAQQKANADRDQIYLSANVVTPAIVAKQLLANNVYSAITDEHIRVLEELEEFIPEEENGDELLPPKDKQQQMRDKVIN